MRFPLSLSSVQRNYSQRNGLGGSITEALVDSVERNARQIVRGGRLGEGRRLNELSAVYLERTKKTTRDGGLKNEGVNRPI